MPTSPGGTLALVIGFPTWLTEPATPDVSFFLNLHHVAKAEPTTAQWFHVYLPSIPVPDVLNVAQILLKRDVFTCPISDLPLEAAYSPYTWIVQHAHHGTQVRLLVDRNLIGHIAGLAKGRALNSPDARCAAAVLAWAQCIDALVDPSVAAHEGAAPGSAAGALDEVQLLRRADNADPQVWADLALGLRTSVLFDELGPEQDLEVTTTDLARSLRDFEVHELTLLRYVTLLREARGSPEPAARKLILWMHEEFLWNSAAICYALAVVGTDAGQVKQPKRARGNDRERTRAGVSNQAWDLTLLTNWQKLATRMNDTKTIPILASLDVDLHHVARRAPIGTATSDYEELWTARWGKSARGLAKLMQDLQRSHDDAREHRVASLDRPTVDALRIQLEEAFAKTFPSH